MFFDGFKDLLNLHRFPIDGISQWDCRHKINMQASNDSILSIQYSPTTNSAELKTLLTLTETKETNRGPNVKT